VVIAGGSGPSELLDGNRIRPYYIDGGLNIQSSGTMIAGPLYVNGDLIIQSTDIVLEGPVFVNGSIKVQAGQLHGSYSVVATGKILLQTTGYDSENIPLVMSINSDIKCQSGSTIGAGLYAPNGEIKLQAVDVYGFVCGGSVAVQSSHVTYATELKQHDDLPGGGSRQVSLISWDIEK